MGRRRRQEEHVNHERWLVSYADFITLLFAFFTSMYAISTVDARKAGQMVFSTRAAFNLDFFPQQKPVLGSEGAAPPPLDSVRIAKEQMVPDLPRPRQRFSPAERSHRGIRTIAREIEQLVAQQGLQGLITVRVERQGLVVSLAEAGFFDLGSAEMKASSLPVFDRIAEVLAASGSTVRVEGHTDSTPVQGGRYRSNWELSAARAAGVITYLVEEFGFPADHLALAGYSSYRPTVPSESAAARARNRRVDLVVLDGPASPPAGAETDGDATPLDSPPTR